MIEFQAKTIYYQPDMPILKDISFTVKKGEIVALTGASGIGKSTILKIIAGIHKGFTGQVSIPKGSRIAFLSQNNSLLPWKTVYENIILLRKIKDKKVDKESAKALIANLGLSGFENKYPLFLSGGQYQRTALGQVFFYEPEIILMDEPFSALDIKTKHEILDLFLKLQKQHNITTLFVTHNEEEAKYMGARIINLKKEENL
ncbi:MAG: ATP-binding cassette domain-containing protein [Lachnoclostridium sp.]